VTQTEHIDAVSAAGRQRFVDGADVDEVLASFAVDGLGIIAAIRAAMLAFDLSLVDARDLVESAQPYRSTSLAVDWHQEVLQRLKPALEALRRLDR
jgi:ribosomal protein L7/L12